jgi:hypothetical protein
MNKNIKEQLLIPLNILYKISPAASLKIIFRIKQGKLLNLKNPLTYNEKINWLKLNYRNKLMPICADKYAVRNYVKDAGCEEILNELLWEGENPEEIPFESLPKEFVIKVTHGSGMNIICVDKADLDFNKTVNQLNRWLKKKFIPAYGEWFYGVVKPRIIIEKFLKDDENAVPLDYKMFCFNNFNGKHDLAFTAIDTDRFIDHKRKIYDQNWKQINNVTVNFQNDSERKIEKPLYYEKMKEYALKLSKPFPHARVDFYIINNKIYFGEITFTSDAGFGRISPESFNKEMGSWINLNKEIGK